MKETLEFFCFFPISNFDEFLQLTKPRSPLKETVSCRGTRRVRAHCEDKYSRLSEMRPFGNQCSQLLEVGCQGNRPRGRCAHKKLIRETLEFTLVRREGSRFRRGWPG